MVSTELGRKLAEIDLDLHRKGTPVFQRPVAAFNLMFPQPDRRDSNASGILDQIQEWYFEKYGDRAVWDGVLGEQPVIIRGKPYVAVIPFVKENTLLRLTDHIKGLPNEVSASLTEEEFRQTSLVCATAFDDFGALYNLETKASLLSAGQSQFVRRAGFDLKAAATILTLNEDTQGSINHSHEAAEKFLKAALLGYGTATAILERLSHNLSKAISRLDSFHPKYNQLRKPVEALEQLLESKSIRYEDVPRSYEHALIAFDAARYTAGFLARQWQLNAERGAEQVVFEPGKMYTDGSGRFCRCITVSRSSDGKVSAKLAFLAMGVPGKQMDAVVTHRGDVSYFHAEVRDPMLVARFEERFKKIIAPTL